MIVRDLQRFVDALLDGNRGYNNDELGEPITFVQFEDRTQVDVGFSGSGLHLHAEVPGIQGTGRGQTVTELDSIQVFQDFLIRQSEPVTDAKVVFGKSRPHVGLGRVRRDSELGATDLLTTEQVADRFNRMKLKIKVRFEMEFHRLDLGPIFVLSMP